MTDVNTYLWAVLYAGVLALIYAAWKTNWINKQDQGTERMVLIGKSIAEGAMAFLKAEYRILGIFVVVVALLLGCLLYTSPSPRDGLLSRMPSSA